MDSETESDRCCSAATDVLRVGVPPGSSLGRRERRAVWPVAVGWRLGLEPCLDWG